MSARCVAKWSNENFGCSTATLICTKCHGQSTHCWLACRPPQQLKKVLLYPPKKLPNLNISHLKRNIIFQTSIRRKTRKINFPGNSAGALFGMVSSRDPFKGWLSDLQRSGMKRSRIESPEQCWFHPGWLLDIGDYTAQLYGDYFISQYKDPVINQPIFPQHQNRWTALTGQMDVFPHLGSHFQGSHLGSHLGKDRHGRNNNNWGNIHLTNGN